MEVKEIRWKSGPFKDDLTAEEAYHAIEKIREANGGELTDDAIVQAAKPKRHILHGIIYRDDDAKAALEHRRAVARTLIRSFEVVYKDAPEAPTRAFQVLRKEPAGSQEKRTAYSTAEEVLSDPVSRDALIRTAIRQAMEFRRRFKALYELQMIFEAIDKVVEEVGS